MGLIFPVQVPHVWGARCGVCFFPFSALTVSLLPTDSLLGQVGSWLHLHPSTIFPHDVFSLISSGESVLLVFGSFSELFTLM